MRRSITATLLSCLSVSAAGCDGIFDVTNPGTISSELLDRPEMLAAFLYVPEAAGAENYAQFAWLSGLISDELMEPGTCTQRIVLDQGLLHADPAFYAGTYDGLAEDQWHAAEATRRITEFVENPDSHWAVARGHFWNGLIMLSRADLFEGVTFDSGPLIQPEEVYGMAIAEFQKAATVAAAAGEVDYVAAAYGSMARAERSLFFETGDASHLAKAAEYAQAALAAQPGFRLDAQYATSGRTNSLYLPTQRYEGCTAVEEHFFAWTDPVTGEKDPRIDVTAAIGRGPQGNIHLEMTKAPVPEAPLPVSRWEEAALIIAEYCLQNDDIPGALQRINEVRNDAGLVDFTSTDPAAIREQLIYERKTEFFLEARGWQDHRYYGTFPDRWVEPAKAAPIDRLLISARERSANDNID